MHAVASHLTKGIRGAAKAARCRLRRVLLRPPKIYTAEHCADALVVGPHPDDETLRAGGLIALKRAVGATVGIVFVTQGEASHSVCCGTGADDVARARREQAVRAAEYLGLAPSALAWQGLQDSRIPLGGEDGFEAAVHEMADRIERFSPAEVYAPHPHDGWRDHEAASGIVREAVRRCRMAPRPELFYYLVWAWYNAPSPFRKHFPRKDALVVDIRPVLAQKRAAMDVYLKGRPAPCGNPWCGKLTKAVIACASRPTEVFFRAADTDD